VIAGSGSTKEAITISSRNTTAAVSGAEDTMDAGISEAGSSTGDNLQKSYPILCTR
jgi:hypothetical protein